MFSNREGTMVHMSTIIYGPAGSNGHPWLIAQGMWMELVDAQVGVGTARCVFCSASARIAASR
jgi:hypothetical protein